MAKPMMTLAAANAAYDAALKRNASTATLVKLSADIDAATARAAKTKIVETEKGIRAVRIANDRIAAKRTKDLANAKAAGQAAADGVMEFSVGDKVIATVRVLPMLSVPDSGFDSVQSGQSRTAVMLCWQALANFSHAKIANERAKAMGLAPSLRDDLDLMKNLLRESLRAAIRAGIATVAA
jgi:hypothetical protein